MKKDNAEEYQTESKYVHVIKYADGIRIKCICESYKKAQEYAKKGYVVEDKKMIKSGWTTEKEKRAHALDVVLEDNVNTLLIRFCSSADEYNKIIADGIPDPRHLKISQETFDFLKDVFG